MRQKSAGSRKAKRGGSPATENVATNSGWPAAALENGWESSITTAFAEQTTARQALRVSGGKVQNGDALRNAMCQVLATCAPIRSMCAGLNTGEMRLARIKMLDAGRRHEVA